MDANHLRKKMPFFFKNTAFNLHQKQVACFLWVFFTALTACNHQGNDAVNNQTMDLSFSSNPLGNNQYAVVGNNFSTPITITILDNIQHKPVPDIQIQFQVSPSDVAQIQTPNTTTNALGIASTNILAIAPGQSFTVTASMVSTAQTQIFTLGTYGTTERGYRARTSHAIPNPSSSPAGDYINIETAGIPFGYIVEVVDSSGGVVTNVNATRSLIWQVNATSSWCGVEPVSPAGTISCAFQNGVCTTAEIYSLNDTRQYIPDGASGIHVSTDATTQALLSVGDGPTGLADTFVKPIQVLPNANYQIILASGPNGPTATPSPALCMTQNPIYYTTDAGPQTLYPVQIDLSGNYISPLTIATNALNWTVAPTHTFGPVQSSIYNNYSQLVTPSQSTLPSPLSNISIAADQTSVTIHPQYLQSNGNSAIESLTLNANVPTPHTTTKMITVNHGNPQYLIPMVTDSLGTLLTLNSGSTDVYYSVTAGAPYHLDMLPVDSSGNLIGTPITHTGLEDTSINAQNFSSVFYRSMQISYPTPRPALLKSLTPGGLPNPSWGNPDPDPYTFTQTNAPIYFVNGLPTNGQTAITFYNATIPSIEPLWTAHLDVMSLHNWTNPSFALLKPIRFQVKFGPPEQLLLYDANETAQYGTSYSIDSNGHAYIVPTAIYGNAFNPIMVGENYFYKIGIADAVGNVFGLIQNSSELTINSSGTLTAVSQIVPSSTPTPFSRIEISPLTAGVGNVTIQANQTWNWNTYLPPSSPITPYPSILTFSPSPSLNLQLTANTQLAPIEYYQVFVSSPWVNNPIDNTKGVNLFVKAFDKFNNDFGFISNLQRRMVITVKGVHPAPTPCTSAAALPFAYNGISHLYTIYTDSAVRNQLYDAYGSPVTLSIPNASDNVTLTLVDTQDDPTAPPTPQPLPSPWPSPLPSTWHTLRGYTPQSDTFRIGSYKNYTNENVVLTLGNIFYILMSDQWPSHNFYSNRYPSPAIAILPSTVPISNPTPTFTFPVGDPNLILKLNTYDANCNLIALDTPAQWTLNDPSQMALPQAADWLTGTGPSITYPGATTDIPLIAEKPGWIQINAQLSGANLFTQSDPIQVIPGVPNHFQITAPSVSPIGSPIPLQAHISDAKNNTLLTYTDASVPLNFNVTSPGGPLQNTAPVTQPASLTNTYQFTSGILTGPSIPQVTAYNATTTSVSLTGTISGYPIGGSINVNMTSGPFSAFVVNNAAALYGMTVNDSYTLQFFKTDAYRNVILTNDWVTLSLTPDATALYMITGTSLNNAVPSPGPGFDLFTQSVSGNLVSGQADLTFTANQIGTVTPQVTFSGTPYLHPEANVAINPSPLYFFIQLPGQGFSQGVADITHVLTGIPTEQTAGLPYPVSLYITDNKFKILKNLTLPGSGAMTLGSYSDVSHTPFPTTDNQFSTYTVPIPSSSASNSVAVTNYTASHFTKLYATAPVAVSFSNPGGALTSNLFRIKPQAPAPNSAPTDTTSKSYFILTFPGQSLNPGAHPFNAAASLQTPIAVPVPIWTAGSSFSATMHMTDAYFNELEWDTANPNPPASVSLQSTSIVNSLLPPPNQTQSPVFQTSPSSFATPTYGNRTFTVTYNSAGLSTLTANPTPSASGTSSHSSIPSSSFVIQPMPTPVYNLVVLPNQFYSTGHTASPTPSVIPTFVIPALPVSTMTAGTAFAPNVYMTDQFFNPIPFNLPAGTTWNFNPSLLGQNVPANSLTWSGGYAIGNIKNQMANVIPGTFPSPYVSPTYSPIALSVCTGANCPLNVTYLPSQTYQVQPSNYVGFHVYVQPGESFYPGQNPFWSMDSVQSTLFRPGTMPMPRYTAGIPFPIDVYGVDLYGNVTAASPALSVGGTFTQQDLTARATLTSSFTAGHGSYNLTFYQSTANQPNPPAFDCVNEYNATTTNCSAKPFLVMPAPASKGIFLWPGQSFLAGSNPSIVGAGTTTYLTTDLISLNIYPVDPYYNNVNDYVWNNIVFSTPNPHAVMPAPIPTATGPVAFSYASHTSNNANTAPFWTLSATATHTPAPMITLIPTTYTINPAPAAVASSSWSSCSTTNTTAGSSVQCTLLLQDQYGNPLTSIPGINILPSSATTPSCALTGTLGSFLCTLIPTKAGTNTFSYTLNGSIQQAGITVAPDSTTFTANLLSPVNINTYANTHIGTQIPITVNIVDQYGNTPLASDQYALKFVTNPPSQVERYITTANDHFVINNTANALWTVNTSNSNRLTLYFKHESDSSWNSTTLVIPTSGYLSTSGSLYNPSGVQTAVPSACTNSLVLHTIPTPIPTPTFLITPRDPCVSEWNPTTLSAPFNTQWISSNTLNTWDITSLASGLTLSSLTASPTPLDSAYAFSNSCTNIPTVLPLTPSCYMNAQFMPSLPVPTSTPNLIVTSGSVNQNLSILGYGASPIPSPTQSFSSITISPGQLIKNLTANSTDNAWALALQTTSNPAADDPHLIVVGSTQGLSDTHTLLGILRLTKNGVLDPNFNATHYNGNISGVQTVDTGVNATAYAVKVNSSNQLFIAGTSANQAIILRLDWNGNTLNPTWTQPQPLPTASPMTIARTLALTDNVATLNVGGDGPNGSFAIATLNTTTGDVSGLNIIPMPTPTVLPTPLATFSPNVSLSSSAYTTSGTLLAGTSYGAFAMARVNTTSLALDTSFGNSASGIIKITPFKGTAVIARGVAVDLTAGAATTNSIYMVGNMASVSPGFILARYTSSGVLDNTFNATGTPGYVQTNLNADDAAYGIVIDRAHYIWVTGVSNQSFALLKYHPSGLLISSQVTPFVGNSSEAHAIQMDTSGVIYVVGKSGSSFALARYFQWLPQ